MKAKTKIRTMAGMNKATMTEILCNFNRDEIRNLCRNNGVMQGRTKEATIARLVCALSKNEACVNFQLGV